MHRRLLLPSLLLSALLLLHVIACGDETTDDPNAACTSGECENNDDDNNDDNNDDDNNDNNDNNGASNNLPAYDPSLIGDPDNGATFFSTHCKVCHGDDALGGPIGPDLTEPTANEPDAGLWEVIQEGEGEMPPSGLTAQETADVIAWLHQQLD